MKTTLTLLVASTALTAAIAVPAWSAMQPPADRGLRPFAPFVEKAPQTMPIVLASDDDDDRSSQDGSRRGHDDEDDDSDDDDARRGGARNPAPTGTVAPPRNGLFGDGTPPQVKVN